MYNKILQINNVNKTSKRSMLESRESQTVLDDETERSIEIGNERGASGLVFFGMQVELAFGAITR
jgi:hypothetical protein